MSEYKLITIEQARKKLYDSKRYHRLFRNTDNEYFENHQEQIIDIAAKDIDLFIDILMDNSVPEKRQKLLVQHRNKLEKMRGALSIYKPNLEGRLSISNEEGGLSLVEE